MSKKRSKNKTEKTDGIFNMPAPPPKIIDMLDREFKEPNVAPPPKTVITALSSADDTIPALPMDAVYTDEKEVEPLSPEVVLPHESAKRFTVVADDTVPALPVKVLYPDQLAQAAPAQTRGGRNKWLVITFAAVAVLILIGGLVSLMVAMHMRAATTFPQVAEKAPAPIPSTEHPRPALPAIHAKPRFAAPPPPSSDTVLNTDLAGYSVLSMLDDWLNSQAGGRGDVLVSVRKAALSLFSPRFGVPDVGLQTLPSSERDVVDTYRKLFQDIGRMERGDASVGSLVAAGSRFADRLAEAAGLEMRRVILCHNVSGFGRYEPLTGPAIRARHVALLQIYVEFANPKPELRDDGRYVYRLSQSIKLRPGDKENAVPMMDTTVSLTELSLSPKRDFFAAQYLRPSRSVSPGDYVVEVSLTDQIGGSMARGKAKLTVQPDSP